MEGVCRLKIGGARHPKDILECALEYKKVGNPWFRDSKRMKALRMEKYYLQCSGKTMRSIKA